MDYETKYKKVFTESSEIDNSKTDENIHYNRENDLKNLDWFQRQVTLLIEIRDALTPQLEIVISYLGNFVVTILTKIVGKSIGLIGKGILQGLGKASSK